jgi:DNA polymerase-3 subunit epsilon
MNRRNTYRFALVLALLFALEVALVAAIFSVVVLDMEQAQRDLLLAALAQRSVLVAALGMLLLFALGIGLHALFRAYLLPMSRLGEDVLLMAANPEHRAVPQGALEARELTSKFNALAAAHQALRDDVQRSIENANRALAEEKDRLAALMSELTLGVVVCNIEGRILLYNTRARQLFEEGHAAGSAVGLGRSVFGAIGHGLIVHALEQVQHELQTGATGRPVSGFLATLAVGRMVRVQMAPVLDADHALVGFVLTLDDISRNIEADSRRDALLLSLTEGTRAALANIRAAAEAMQSFPDMGNAQRAAFAAVIEEESLRLSRQIDHATEQHGTRPDSQWQLEEMRGTDLIALLLRRIHVPALHALPDAIDESIWLRIDSYALTQAMVHLAERLAAEADVTDLRVRLQRAGRLACLDFSWVGKPLTAETMQLWERSPMQVHASGAMTPGTVVLRHGGESVYRPGSLRSEAVYRLLLPLSEPQAPFDIPPRQPGRPEFYDFDLFHQPGQNREVDQSLLSELNYTVFDTETTGLQPADDDIISIGALRVVNGRLLHQESFDQLIKPRCPVSAESVRIHGITDKMLEDQPGAEKVLQRFYRFAEESVLVAHNAAFDMRFLQMQEARTGVRFTQPVLDTLLLSQVLHPHQQQHTLEAIAARLGVTVVGRHTALGDAIVTGEVFLKMIPLLAENGIRTLKEAREAARQTLYARVEY